jgi:hypothetical protein
MLARDRRFAAAGVVEKEGRCLGFELAALDLRFLPWAVDPDAVALA